MHQTPHIVAIVGLDGCGKTTQARLLTARLQAAGYDAKYIHALYYFTDCIPYADQLRKQIGPRKTRTKTQNIQRPQYIARRIVFGLLSYIFALGTILLVSRQSDDQILIFDRYYQQFFYDVSGFASGPLARSLPQPWRIIYLDADIDVLRVWQDTEDKLVDEQYYSAVSELFTSCMSDKWLQLPATLPVETLHEHIFKEISQGLEQDQLLTP